MWIKPQNGPYGAPRGNRAMASKRTHGESAQTKLLRAVSLEKCDTPGCLAHAIITTDVSVGGRKRACLEHTLRKTRGTADVSKLLKLPWE